MGAILGSGDEIRILLITTLVVLGLRYTFKSTIDIQRSQAGPGLRENNMAHLENQKVI